MVWFVKPLRMDSANFSFLLTVQPKGAKTLGKTAAVNLCSNGNFFRFHGDTFLLQAQVFPQHGPRDAVKHGVLLCSLLVVCPLSCLLPLIIEMGMEFIRMLNSIEPRTVVMSIVLKLTITIWIAIVFRVHTPYSFYNNNRHC